MRKKAWGTAALSIGLVATLGGCASGGASPEGGSAAGEKLTILIGSSGDAETSAVQAAADAWGTENDTEVEVIAASDLNQQLAQGFAGGDEPDLFYMGWDQFQTFAGKGFLETYAADLPNAGDFYPELVDTFTSEDVFTCAPKDFSTLGLIVNTDAWAAAGLTEADVPTDWAGLEAVATKLTTGAQVGLSFGLEYARAGAFMNQASHYVDLLDWLIGPVESVQAYTATLARNIQVEDTGVLSIRWRTGALGSMSVTMLTYPKNLEGSITILGEKGTVKLGGVAVNKIEHWEFEDSDPDDELVQQASYDTTSVYGFGHPLYYDNVISSLRGEAEPETDGREGLHSLELLIATYLSARDGRRVALPLEY